MPYIDNSHGNIWALSKNFTALLLHYRLRGQSGHAVAQLCFSVPRAPVTEHKCAEKKPKSHNFNSILSLLHTTS